jgi:hypothetical protein
VGDHLPKRKAMSSYQFDGSGDIKRAPSVSGQEADSIVPKIKKWKNKIETWF